MDMEAAQHSIHLQYFFGGRGGGRFTDGLKEEACVPCDLHTARPACLLNDLGGLFALISKDQESDYFRRRWARAVIFLSRLWPPDTETDPPYLSRRRL